MPTSTKEPPLVDVKVTNPVTYLKNWWKKVMGEEGVDFRFRIHPITAIAIAFVVASVGFGVGRFSLNIPFLKYTEITKSPTPAPTDAWRETAFTGTLQFSKITGKYFLLVTSSSEAITLQVPKEMDLAGSVGKRIFASGSYNKSTRTLIVAEARDMEILPKSPVPIPTIESTPTPTPTQEASPSASPQTGI